MYEFQIFSILMMREQKKKRSAHMRVFIFKEDIYQKTSRNDESTIPNIELFIRKNEQ
jgi:hypothetical protein